MNKQTKKTIKPVKNNGKKETSSLINTSVHVKRVPFVKLFILFIVSFSIVGAGVLGYHWYGKQLRALFRTNMSKFTVEKQPVKKTTSFSNGTYFDPLDLVQVIEKRDAHFIFLDIRSSEEYKKEHVKGAVSAPLYSIENGQIYYFEISSALQKAQIDKSKQVVVYGPSSSFQKQQEVVVQLKKNGYAVKQLAVGWNELRHFQNIWIPEPLWGTIDVNSLIDQN